MAKNKSAKGRRYAPVTLTHRKHLPCQRSFSLFSDGAVGVLGTSMGFFS
ncbi:MAG: hypothetical protein QM610_16150 [Chitinophagaceae bacterium]